jgi:hypothetical protein
VDRLLVPLVGRIVVGPVTSELDDAGVDNIEDDEDELIVDEDDEDELIVDEDDESENEDEVGRIVEERDGYDEGYPGAQTCRSDRTRDSSWP